jgi:crotonobetainyl-CoA:carnitine CoA-transferase CaiB-like acyl-CoA transferase
MRPLSSLKILDFTTLLPGPFATMMLADLGADVVRVEAPHLPDLVRSMPPFDQYGFSAWHGVLNRNKRSIALDLKHPESTAIVKNLASTYDIVIEQFRPGVMARLGLDYEALKQINPRIIYCSITGYGQTGPYRDRAGHDINYLSLAGVMSHTGRRKSGPAGMGLQIADVGGGAFGAITGVLAAVIQRQIEGVGQCVDISMFDLAVAWNALAMSEYFVGGQVRGYEDHLLNGGSFYDCYETADGRYLSIGSLEPKFWQQVCLALSRPDLFTMGLDQHPNSQKAVRSALIDIIKTKPLDAWMRIFDRYDACVEPVLTVDDVEHQPQVLARNLVVSVPNVTTGAQKQIACPIRFSNSEAEYRFTGAPTGWHTDEVLSNKHHLVK